MQFTNEEILMLLIVTIGIGILISSFCFSFTELKSLKTKHEKSIHILGGPVCLIGLGLIFYIQYIILIRDKTYPFLTEHFPAKGIWSLYYIFMIIFLMTITFIFQKKLNFFFERIRDTQKFNIKIINLIKILPLSLLVGCIIVLCFSMLMVLI